MATELQKQAIDLVAKHGSVSAASKASGIARSTLQGRIAAARKYPKPEEATPVEVIAAFKGFNKNMQCRGYQFEVGKTYLHDGPVKACESGFHSCENPIDVLNYYPLIGDDGKLNRFATVKASGSISRHGYDSKIASASLTIEAEIKLPEIIKSAIKFVTDICTSKEPPTSGDYSQLAASGCSSQLAASGHYSKLAASGDSSQLAASGCSSQLAASGCSSQLAASGDSSQLAASGCSSQLAASGDYSKLAASGCSSQLAASGDYSKLAASGDSSQLAASGCSSQLAASGDYSKLAASGKSSIVAASATNCSASVGKLGCIVLTRWVDSEKRYRTHVAYEGENGIKAGVFYKLDEDGNFVEVK